MTDTVNGPRVALVIGSGSVKCAAALGVQRVLERAGITLDLVVGCSGGSIYATLIAEGWSAEEATEAATRLWTREVTSRSNRRALLKAMQPRLFGFTQDWGLRDDRPVLAALREPFEGHRVEDTEIPLVITATDFETGEQVRIVEGDVVDAIRASIAMPFVFPPWRHQGRVLVDGYLSDPMPVGAAVREGATTILALGFESPYQREVTSAARYAFQVSSVMTNNLLRSNFAFHSLAHHGEVIPIIPRFDRRIGLFATELMPYAIEAGEQAAVEELEAIRSSIAAAQP